MALTSGGSGQEYFNLSMIDPRLADAYRRQAYATALEQSAIKPGATHWTGAVAQGLQGLMGGYEERQAAKDYQDALHANDPLLSELSTAAGGGRPSPVMPVSAPGGAPPATPAGGDANTPSAAPGGAPGATAPAPDAGQSLTGQAGYDYYMGMAARAAQSRDPRAMALIPMLTDRARTAFNARGPIITEPNTGQKGQYGPNQKFEPIAQQPIEQQQQEALTAVQQAAKTGDYSKVTPQQAAAYTTYYNSKFPPAQHWDEKTRTLTNVYPDSGGLPHPSVVTGRQANAPGVAPGPTPGTATTSAGPTQPQLETQQGAVKDQIQSDEKRVTADEASADATRGVVGVTQSIRDLMGNVNTGWTADLRTKAGNILQTLGADPKKIQEFTGIDPASGQALQKRFLELVADRVKQMGGREGAQVLQTFQNAYPNLEMTPQALNMMTRVIDMDQHYREERAAAQREYHTNARDNLGPDLKGYKGLGGFGAAWDKGHDPRVYMAAGLAAAGMPYDTWARGLSNEQRQQAAGMVGRYYPGGTFLDRQGNPRGAP